MRNGGQVIFVAESPVLGIKCTKIPVAPVRLDSDAWRMAESLIVQSLKDKRAEIHGRIAAYQAQIAQAKHDLAHINVSMRYLSASNAPSASNRTIHLAMVFGVYVELASGGGLG
jgi:hypothetical protein